MGETGTNNDEVAYASDSDLSCVSSSSSSSGSDSSSVFEGDNHLLSPPPPLSTPNATGDRDTPLRQRSRSSSFASPILRPLSNTRSRSGSILVIDPDANPNHVDTNVITPTGSYQDISIRASSNSRNRTPVRNTTPVLGPVNRSTLAQEERASSNERSRSSTPNTSSNSRPSSASRSSTSRLQPVVGLGANLSIGTILRAGSLSALHERPSKASSSIGRQQPRSAKQGPGHRKVRRWNNDKFIGIASDISNSLSQKNPQMGMRIANIYAEADMHKGKYTMPNAPRGNRTIFGTLVKANRGLDLDGQSDDGYDSDCCKVKLDPEEVAKIRERFVDGEVGVNEVVILSEAAKEKIRKREEELYKDGKRMMKVNVNERLVNVVIRACKNSGFTRNVVNTFEDLLLSLNHPKSNSVKSSVHVIESEIWKQVLVQKPFITRKLNAETKESNVTVRLFFSDGKSKGAFNRLLLHAVCQFHGLQTASSTTSKGHRIMTVTGGCKGEHLRFLDYVPFDGVDPDSGTTTEEEELSPSPVISANMAALKVT